MAKAKTLMKGNHAIAEAAVRAGCSFFAGYPITPQSEILEYMSSRLPEIGGVFVQTESEIAGISMVLGAAATGTRTMTSSSGPGFSLMQEGISYIAAAQLPTVIVDVTRYGCGLGDIASAQGDYLQLAKNGGHGDYRCIVLTPGNLQEAVDFVIEGYEIAEKYRNPVLVSVDGAIGKMVEAVSLPDEIHKHDQDQFEWALRERKEGEERQQAIQDIYRGVSYEDSAKLVLEKIKKMEANEQRAEKFMTEDADLIVVAYGTMSRVAKEAVLFAREEGLKMGLIRPQTIWPFPVFAFEGLNPKGYLVAEQSAMPQMAEDVVNTVRGKAPVYSYVTGITCPNTKDIIEKAKEILAGKAEEV